jgi:small subunit ribosomal protein S1
MQEEKNTNEEVNETPESVEPTAEETTAEVTETVEETVEAAEETVEEVAEEVTEAVEEAVAEAEEVAAEVEEKVEEKVEAAAQEVVAEVEEKVEEAQEVVAEVEEKVEEAVAEAEEATAEVEEKLELDVDKVEEVQTAHDDFDWSQTNKHVLPYSDEEIENYLKQYEATLNDVLEGEIVSARVNSIDAGDVVLDINYKSDGLISLSEFRDNPDLAVGDMVDVYVEEQENERGQLVLSAEKQNCCVPGKASSILTKMVPLSEVLLFTKPKVVLSLMPVDWKHSSWFTDRYQAYHRF